MSDELSLLSEKVIKKIEDPLIEGCSFLQVFGSQDRYKKGDKMDVDATDGELYNACKGKDCEYVLKIQKRYNKNEIDLQMKSSSFGYSPQIKEIWFCYEDETLSTVRTSIFVMNRLNKTLNEYLSSNASLFDKISSVRKAIELLQNVNKHNIYHNDSHTSNFMFNNDGSLFLIDFGKSSYTNQLGMTNIYTSDFNSLYNDILIHNNNMYKEDKKEILSVILPYLNNEKKYLPKIRDISEISGQEREEKKDTEDTEDTKEDKGIKNQIQTLLDKNEVLTKQQAFEIKDRLLTILEKRKFKGTKSLEKLFSELLDLKYS